MARMGMVLFYPCNPCDPWFGRAKDGRGDNRALSPRFRRIKIGRAASTSTVSFSMCAR